MDLSCLTKAKVQHEGNARKRHPRAHDMAIGTVQEETMATSPTMAAHRKASSVLLSPSLPVLLLLLFLLSYTTFSLLLCPLLPMPPPQPIASITSTRVDVITTSKTLQAFHSSSASKSSPTSSISTTKHNSRSFSKKNKSLLKVLLRRTARTQRFAARAAELFASQCAHRFFMTWLAPLPQFGRRELGVVESLFKWHRDACLLIVSDTMDSAVGEDKLKPFLVHGFRVAAASPDLAYLLNGTPAEAWLGRVQRGDVSAGKVPLGQNLSNLLRLAALYKYGGVYIDADVVVLKSFVRLRNAIGAQAVDAATGYWTRLNNAVMVFDRGHPLLREFLAEFAATFHGSKWGHNGPYLVSRVVARLRRRPGLDVAVLPPQAFYPVDWIKIAGMFHAPKGRKEEWWVRATVDRIKGESFGIHLWNRESRRLEVEEGSVVGRLISDNCLFCNASLFVVQD